MIPVKMPDITEKPLFESRAIHTDIVKYPISTKAIRSAQGLETRLLG